ncbi:tRNA uridine(34) hydroxylase [Candidatus Similichlamydia laticola]|uniref:tRNA uridine(34) hydroxylase n=1 Tax=Candidatus Similichlamydia laticola TaxID=2170265 RepID=A0A369KHP3_9BACT|nr:tRNA uridine(34) hydroxylase [Candidatus Similichlamydia laticola]RDB31284.1 hypothetical protein HAT2_00622 [Candidatus Similichlamydia laticola]
MTLPSKKAPYVVVSYYRLGRIEDVTAEVKSHFFFFQSLDVRSRVYVALSGINAQLSIAWEHYPLLEEWLYHHPFLRGFRCKVQPADQHVFPRLNVREKRQLVAFDCEIDVSKTGTYLSPREWRAWLEREERPYLIDVRNDYEWEVGHFEGSVKPHCTSSREFITLVDGLKKTVSSEKEIMMCCTGGIRCEFFSSFLLNNGFKRVYQLEGGILEYGRQEGNAHWKGKLFVFDDRLCVDIGETPAPTIGICHQCGLPSDCYYNCANMDCNHLFLSCSECLQQWKGCCRAGCQNGVRVRHYTPGEAHRPFRRKSYYQQSSQPIAGGRT